MTEKFLQEQLSRAVLVAMLEQGKLTEAVSCYEVYRKKLLEIASQDAEKELEYATNILIAKLTKQDELKKITLTDWQYKRYHLPVYQRKMAMLGGK